MSTTETTEQSNSDLDRTSDGGGARDRYVVVRSLADGGTAVSVGSVDPTRYVDLDELAVAVTGAAAGESETDTAIDYLLNVETWSGPDSVFGLVAAAASPATVTPPDGDREVHIEGGEAYV